MQQKSQLLQLKNQLQPKSQQLQQKKTTTAAKKTTAKKTTTATKKTAAASTKKTETAAKKTTATKKTATAASKKAAPAKAVVEDKVTAKKVEEVAEVQVEEKATPKAEKAEVKEVVENTPVEFDWDAFEAEERDTYTSEERKKLNDMYDGTLTQVEEKSLIQGSVIAITKKEVVININYKSEGVVPKNEFRYNADLKIGDTVDVYIENMEDKTGQLVVSHKTARTHLAWIRVNEVLESGEIITGFVKCRTKGGLIVDVFGIEAFLPGSQIDVKPIRDYDQYVNKTMEFKVVKINHEFKNIVVSHKALIEADIEEQKKEIIGQLEKGQVLEGVVKNVTSYGVFIDLGGVDGLIHITDLSWSRINHPNEIVELDQKLNVVILDFDEDKSRIQLGLKQLSKHPWEALADDVNVGDKVKGKVVVIADYGAFIEVAEGVEGLVHVSEMSWSTHLRSAQDFVSVGDEVEAVILTLDREERKMSLGIKQLTPDPWTDITAKYPVGSKHSGIVRNFTNFGVFVELQEGIDGLIYISDLSWTKKIKHPSEFCNVGDTLDVVVLELDVEGRKLSLGHKQTEANPWDKYESEFALGTSHTAAIAEVVDKGATINFNDDIVAFVPSRHMEKEDGSKLKKGETAEFKVIEFNKEFKRVVASHSAVFKAEEVANVKAAVKKAAAVAAEAKPTLGDANDALQALKDKMDGKK